MKFMEPAINKIHHQLLKKFDTHWIPDTAQHDFAGKLSHTLFRNSEYIGSLSRLKIMATPTTYDVIAIISGPEPQRTFFFEKVKKQLTQYAGKSLIVGGNISQKTNEQETINNCTIVQFMNAVELNTAIASASVVVGRSGYSTIMDLVALQKKAVLIPTPGQTEQIYLAQRFHDVGSAFYEKQDNMYLFSAIEKAKLLTGFDTTKSSPHLLENAINKLV